ncbi:17.3 kDa class II heat shock protein-like [Vicia villosa]|uniref:17.3 kDa class II heat shock protein-like n=1 Tax=Vicia villosa TaxID=3911 RepID=UPI00273AA241|nr:17.3 kDa class II heat shock protein-like [Vicia villosa]
MKRRHYPSSDSTSSSDDYSSSEEDEISTQRLVKINQNNKKPKPQEKENPNGKTPVIEQQPPTMIRCDNMDIGAATPADVKVYPDSYVYEIDMPGLKFGSEIKVDVEDDDYLVISGEKKREEGVEYLRMERRFGKFMRKFVFPKNANTDAVSAICQDGVLRVTVQKLPRPPQPKNPRRTIPITIA